MLGLEEPKLTLAGMASDGLLNKVDAVVGTMVVDIDKLHFIEGLSKQALGTLDNILRHAIDGQDNRDFNHNV